MIEAYPPQACPLCGGRKEAGTTTFSADTGDGVVVVRNVKAMVCAHCGEEWIDNTTAQQLEAIVWTRVKTSDGSYRALNQLESEPRQGEVPEQITSEADYSCTCCQPCSYR
ncbi:MAG: hypothetical protein QOJ64_304 [Acidobacteriota bacterium]|nr:hypothetical protein [Acidobacteriota bacterium]